MTRCCGLCGKSASKDSDPFGSAASDGSSPMPANSADHPILDERRIRLTKSLSDLALDSNLLTQQQKYKRSQSIMEWDRPHQTAITFDWDDTLFPTTWLRSQYPKLKWHEPMASNSEFRHVFKECETKVEALVRHAADLGKVHIVTLASHPWVDISIRNFMPGLEHVFRELNVSVAYARDELAADETEVDIGKLSTDLKRRAMHKLMKKFYSQYEKQSWKNVLSIGDSFFEVQALRDLVSDHRKAESEKRCRAKTVKLAEAPDMDQVQAQLSVLLSWMRPLVSLDDDADIDLDGPIDGVMNWQKKLVP